MNRGNSIPGLVPASFLLFIFSWNLSAAPEDEIMQMLAEDRPYHAVTPEQFEQLGWALPDAGKDAPLRRGLHAMWLCECDDGEPRTGMGAVSVRAGGCEGCCGVRSRSGRKRWAPKRRRPASC